MSTVDDVTAMARHMVDVDTATTHAASPLGAWLLREIVSTSAPGARPAARAAVETFRRSSHPGVTVESRVWAADHVDDAGLRHLSRESDARAPGFGPEHTTLDAWTSQLTDGVYDAFPVRLDPDPMAMLSHPELAGTGTSVVAAVSTATTAPWLGPLVAAADGQLCAAWGVGSVLRQRDSCGLVFDDTVGMVGVTLTVARTGLSCLSVIADADVSRDRVMAAAHRIARRRASGEQVFLAHPPRGGTSWWSAAEHADTDPFGAPVNTALTPAWMAFSDHDLYHSGLDFYGAFTDRFRDGMNAPHHDFRSRQFAAMWFTAAQFIARSVTGLHVAPMFPEILRALRVVAENRVDLPEDDSEPTSVILRYDHPFAAVACTASEHPDSPWHAMPVWSAWVTQAIEAV